MTINETFKCRLKDKLLEGRNQISTKERAARSKASSMRWRLDSTGYKSLTLEQWQLRRALMARRKGSVVGAVARNILRVFLSFSLINSMTPGYDSIQACKHLQRYNENASTPTTAGHMYGVSD